ncbi:MAG: DUF4241 domain-containing protein [Candidatus Xenobia bacterium]
MNLGLLQNLERPLSLPDGTRLNFRPAGTVSLPTGKLMACDPFEAFDVRPVATLTPGAYPVKVGVMQGEDEMLVALGALVVREAPPTRWKEAATTFIESGHFAFFDAAILEEVQEDEGLEEALEDAMGPLFGELTVDCENGTNVVAFLTGYGDGEYTTWTGYGADGSVVCLVVDFRLL